jgi:hypothetical protein
VPSFSINQRKKKSERGEKVKEKRNKQEGPRRPELQKTPVQW